ncbi:MAG: hypothetical protein JO296_21750 [Pseudonocardiales bacterium]|nr:hypothetical protein [Pseudonocardiales bacterium]MBV9652741.1 hypothetical protein [Pseudonocardiales bacterium]
MSASSELLAAAVGYRARATPGDIHLAECLEQAAHNAAARESAWEVAGYSTQEQTQLAECWWRNELAVARSLHPWRE